jgi:hypothetical protein
MRFDAKNDGKRGRSPYNPAHGRVDQPSGLVASNGRTGLRISSLRGQQPSHALLRLSDHGLHKGLHDSRDSFTRHTHSAAGLPAVPDQLVYFGNQTLSRRSGGDLVFHNSHFALLPESPSPHKLCPKATEPIGNDDDCAGTLRKGALTGGAGLVDFPR